jgi:hypothetical protein
MRRSVKMVDARVRRRLVRCTGVMAVLAICFGNGAAGSAPVQALPSEPTLSVASQGSAVKAELAWHWVHWHTSGMMLSWAAHVENTSNETREGMQLAERAFDGNGVEVHSFTSTLPRLGPGMRIPYVSGVGAPARPRIGETKRVELNVTNGTPTSASPQVFTIESAELTCSYRCRMDPQPNWGFCCAKLHGFATTGEEALSSRSIRLAIIFRNDAGAIVGSESIHPYQYERQYTNQNRPGYLVPWEGIVEPASTFWHETLDVYTQEQATQFEVAAFWRPE